MQRLHEAEPDTTPPDWHPDTSSRVFVPHEVVTVMRNSGKGPAEPGWVIDDIHIPDSGSYSGKECAIVHSPTGLFKTVLTSDLAKWNREPTGNDTAGANEQKEINSPL